jgi:hypothetical protein
MGDRLFWNLDGVGYWMGFSMDLEEKRNGPGYPWNIP